MNYRRKIENWFKWFNSLLIKKLKDNRKWDLFLMQKENEKLQKHVYNMN